MLDIQKLDDIVEEIKIEKWLTKQELLEKYKLNWSYYRIKMVNWKEKLYGTTRAKFNELLKNKNLTIDNFINN